MECTDYDVYSLYMHHFDQLVRREDDCCGFSYNRGTDESSCLLYEYSYESDDAFDGFVMISMSMASMRRIAEVLNEKTDIHNPEHPVYEVADGSITI